MFGFIFIWRWLSHLQGCFCILVKKWFCILNSSAFGFLPMLLGFWYISLYSECLVFQFKIYFWVWITYIWLSFDGFANQIGCYIPSFLGHYIEKKLRTRNNIFKYYYFRPLVFFCVWNRFPPRGVTWEICNRDKSLTSLETIQFKWLIILFQSNLSVL